MMRRHLLGLAAALVLAGCGGGSSTPEPTFSLRWDRPSYTATIPPGGGTVTIDAVVVPTGSVPLPDFLAVELSPASDACTGFGVARGPWWMNRQGFVSVRMSVGPDCVTGQYPIGTRRVTATMLIGDRAYTATTDVIITR